jgi:hypothetical protein
VSEAAIAGFEEIAQQYYPGSRRPIKTVPAAPARRTPTEGLKSRTYVIRGRSIEFFTIGQLAVALNRRPVTIRKWEHDGILPKSQYATPSDDPRGRQRLYTKEQVEGIVKIAIEEKVFDPYRPNFKGSNFTTKVVALFKELS